MLLPCLVQVTESISGSVVPLAMFEKVYKLRPYPTLQIAIETQITDGNIGDVYPTSTSKLCEFIRFSVIDGGFALEISHVLCVSSHFWPFTKVNLVLVNFDKHWDWGRPLPPLVGTKSQVFPKIFFEGSPYPMMECLDVPNFHFLGSNAGC